MGTTTTTTQYFMRTASPIWTNLQPFQLIDREGCIAANVVGRMVHAANRLVDDQIIVDGQANGNVMHRLTRFDVAARMTDESISLCID